MDQGVPPPPGGYGLPPECGGGSEGPPPPRPNIIPPAPPPVSPFRENYYVPPTSNPSGKRWAFGGIGAAILGVRLLLLCGRMADSGSDDYSYNPSSYPTYDPTAFGALFDASLAPSHSPSAQQIAVGADGRAYWLEGDQVTVQGHDSKDVLDPKALGKPIQGEFVPQYGATLVATDKSLLWAAGGRFDQGEVVSSIVAMPLAGGTPKVIVKNLVATPEGLTLDAQTLWFTEPGDHDARNLMRVSTSGGTPTKIASWSDPFELRETLALAVDASNVYFVQTTHDPKDDLVKSQTLSRVSKSGGKPTVLATLPEFEAVGVFATTKGGVFFTTTSEDDGIGGDTRRLYWVAAAGGAKTLLMQTTSGTFGDVVADTDGVFLSRREDSTWNILRVGDDGGSTTRVSGLAREPHFGVSRYLLFWSTGTEVSSQRKSTSLP